MIVNKRKIASIVFLKNHFFRMVNKSMMSREFSSVGKTLHYICRESSHLFALRVKFLSTGLFDQKRKEKTNQWLIYPRYKNVND
jgi:hypothetical protein